MVRAPANAILAPNFKFEDMGIGGLDSEFSVIFRRAFASRVFPPGLVEKLGIQHVKGMCVMEALCTDESFILLRYSSFWATRNWEDTYGTANR